jgi:site-specific recombinase
MKFKRSYTKPSLIEYVILHFDTPENWTGKEDSLEILIELIRLIRPAKKQKNSVDITAFIAFLQGNQSIAQQLSIYVKQVLKNKKCNKILSDAGILQDVDFLFEMKRRIYAKILPNQPQKDTLEYVLNQVFYRHDDILWVSQIPREQLNALLDVLGFGSIYASVEKKSPLSEMLLSMILISQRICGRAMEPDVIKMVPEFETLESPFVAFEKELLLINEEIKVSEQHYISSASLSYRQLLVLHKQANQFVDKAFSNSSKYGISLRVNQNLLRIRQQLERLQVLIPLLKVDVEEDKRANTIGLALLLIKFNCYKNNVRKFFLESTQLISYEITQHTAKTGEHYITESKSEYFTMFIAALGGGFIVGMLCIIKILLSKIDTSYFGHAFLYSINYAFGFIAIYIMGFTLATKQPAMTASALIKSLEEGMKVKGRNRLKHESFALLFARVFRSQFIAFVGNVVMAFPISLLGAWLIDMIFKKNIAAAKWDTLLTDISPIHSLAILHAAIAGLFLFLSGIISGSVANRGKHNQVYFRIQEHPLLKRAFGKTKTKKLASVYEKKWPGIISNFWFGVFMGTTASVGLFLGLDLDVRHITFASGNLALGIYGANYHVSQSMLFWGIFGIGVIGAVNFLVSFSLSLGLAFRSRNIPFIELKSITVAVWKHFKRRPWSFFFPTESKQQQITTTNNLSTTKE